MRTQITKKAVWIWTALGIFLLVMIPLSTLPIFKQPALSAWNIFMFLGLAAIWGHLLGRFQRLHQEAVAEAALSAKEVTL
jgi:hypothetical protein